MLDATTGFLRQADASAARSTLGLGTLATLNSVSASTGGTGLTSYTTGDLLFADSATSLAKLSATSSGNALISNGVGTAPSYGKIGLTTHVSGTLPVANGGTGVTTSTGTGANVLSNSPTLVTPILGTPSSGTLTSCTGLPLTTGVTGTLPVANGGTGVTTSTGSGSNVLSTSPTLVTPILGTPTSGTLTSCTGLPLTTGVTGTLPVANGGTGVTTSTGTGSNVLSNSPTLVTPVLGTPSSGTLTSCTGLPLTTGVTGVLPVANGGTGVTTSTGTGANVLANSPILVTPDLGIPSAGDLANCTNLSLTTGVTDVLPVANGGTGTSESAYGEYFLNGAATTTIASTATFYKVLGSTAYSYITASTLNIPVTNRLQYIGTGARRFFVTVCSSLHGTNNDKVELAVAVNGMHIDGSITNISLRGASVSVQASAQCIIELDTNDYVEVFVRNATGTNSITFDYFNLCAHALV